MQYNFQLTLLKAGGAIGPDGCYQELGVFEFLCYLIQVRAAIFEYL